MYSAAMSKFGSLDRRKTSKMAVAGSVSSLTGGSAISRKKDKAAYQQQQYLKDRSATSDSLESRSSRSSTGSMDDDWCVVTEASINKEIVLDMDNNEEVVQLAASYISRQLMQIAEEDMSAEIVDKIFKVLMEVGEMDDQILQRFILEFINEQELWDKQRKKGDDDTKTSHRAVIKMLLELLRVSPVPVENNVLWVKLLGKLATFPQDIPIVIDLKVAATVLGTMAVHSNIVQIQEQGCRVLESITKFKPTPTQKAPVRESGIQVLVMAMEKHYNQPPVMRAACCVLANLTSTMSEMTSWAMHQGFSDEEAEKLIVMSLDILEYIKEYAMPHLDHTMTMYKEDEIVQTEGLKIKACFGCHSLSRYGYHRSGYSSLKRRQVSILKSHETTRSPRGSTPPRRVTFSHELDTQLEMSDTESEFGEVENPKRHTVCGALDNYYDSDDGAEDGYEEVADLAKLCNRNSEGNNKSGIKYQNVSWIPDPDNLPYDTLAIPNGEAILLDNEEEHDNGNHIQDIQDNPDDDADDVRILPQADQILENEMTSPLAMHEESDETDNNANTRGSYDLIPDCVSELLNEVVDRICCEMDTTSDSLFSSSSEEDREDESAPVFEMVQEEMVSATMVVGDNTANISAALNDLAGSKSDSVTDVESNVVKYREGSQKSNSDCGKETVEGSRSDEDKDANISIKEQRLTRILDSCMEDKFFTAICSDLEQLQMELETASALVTDGDDDTNSSRNTSPFTSLIKQSSYDIDSSCESLSDALTDHVSSGRTDRIYDNVALDGFENGCIDLQRVVDNEYFTHNSGTSPFEKLSNVDGDIDAELKDICDLSPASSESGYGNEVEVCESPCKLMEIGVEESGRQFSEYNEIDIVEALVKAGLMNEEDTNMETGSSENDQEKHSCEEDSSAGEQFSPMVRRASLGRKHSLSDNFMLSENSKVTLDDVLTNELPFATYDFVNHAYIQDDNTTRGLRSNGNANKVDNRKEDNGNGQPRRGRAITRHGSATFSYGSCADMVVKRRDRSKSGNRRLSAQHRREAFAGNYNHHYEQLAVELERQRENDTELQHLQIPMKPKRSKGRGHVYEQVQQSFGNFMLAEPPTRENVTSNLLRERESLSSSPTSSVSSTSISFTEWSDLDAVYERDEEGSVVSADGILESSMMKRQWSTGESVRKDVARRRALSHDEDYTPSPPKPRRTWYYTSSADVRKSLVRNPSNELDVASLFSATYASVSKIKPVSLPDIRKTNTNASSDSGVATGDEDLLVSSRSHHHLYEEVCVSTSDLDEAEPPMEKAILRIRQQQPTQSVRSEVRKTQLLDQDSSEATYSVCTLWVNNECSKALGIFDELTKRLCSPYSILPATKQLEDSRKLSLGSVLDDMEFDFPAWTSILNVLANDEPNWTLPLSAMVLPIVDRLFFTKDEAIVDAAIELVQVIIKKFGKEVEKNHSGGLFRTRYRDDCRTCFLWLSKLFTRVGELIKKESQREEDLDNLLHISLLNSLQETLQPFCHRSSRLTMLKD